MFHNLFKIKYNNKNKIKGVTVTYTFQLSHLQVATENNRVNIHTHTLKLLEISSKVSLHIFRLYIMIRGLQQSKQINFDWCDNNVIVGF